MTEQIIVPKLRFSGFEAEHPNVTTLKNVLSIFNGFAFKSTDSRERGVRWIKIADVGIQEISDKNISYLPESFLEKYKKFKLNKGDIVVALTRPVLNGKLKISYIDENSKDTLLNQRVGKLLSNEHLDYVFYLLQCNRVITNIVKNIGGTDPPNLAPSEVNHIKAWVPSLLEQQKIASFLSKVDEKIGLLTEKKAKLTEYKKGVMQQLFNGRFEISEQSTQDGKITFIPPTLRFKADDGSDFPDWEEKTLGDYEELIHGDGDWILAKDISENSEHRVVQLGNVGFGAYVEKKLKTISESSFKDVKGTPILDGDLLINRMIDAGKMNCCIFKKTGKYITSVDVCWIRENNIFDNYFLSNLLITRMIQKNILSLSSGSGRVRISKKNLFEKLILPIPSRSEQAKIANFLSAIDQKIELANSEVEKAKQWKKGLLQQMFV